MGRGEYPIKLKRRLLKILEDLFKTLLNWSRKGEDKNFNEFIRLFFNSHDELVDCDKKRGRKHGCVITVQRSRDKSVDLACNRGGEPKLKAMVTHAGGIKRCFPFKLIGRHNAGGDCWKLEVVNEMHNHDLVVFEEGHATLRKMTDEELDMVATLHRLGVRARKLIQLYGINFPITNVLLRTYTTTVRIVKEQDKIGNTPMKVLENFLQNHEFVFHTRENPTNNRAEDVSFCHQMLHTMWRAFPDVLLIDTTYNTNLYKWLYVQFFGVASTSNSFCIALAVIIREREVNFTWALE
ncbi:putative protein FAR1-RELATED SEQUENCE 10 [Bidens hawaiensis]|uniref:putative protein FAR1-RELATED SEQUENCE 10 n=1 Tax=Bidens hawaiensis TaxID=980011 RepID=UPI00404994A3